MTTRRIGELRRGLVSLEARAGAALARDTLSPSAAQRLRGQIQVARYLLDGIRDFERSYAIPNLHTTFADAERLLGDA